MSGGIGQDGELIYALQEYIETPGTSENMRLFIDKLDGIPKLKKNNGTVIPFPTTGDAPSGLDNVHMIYVNGDSVANGDGGIFTPFNTVHAANTFMNLPANDLNTKNYVVNIMPGEYDGVDINLPLNAGVALVGLDGAGSTILNFSVFFTPSLTANANYSVENLAILGLTGLAINGAGLGVNVGSFSARNCALIYNSASIGANFSIILHDCGILGGLINGKLSAINCSLIDDINVNIGAKFYTTGLLLFNAAAKVNVVGTGQFYTASMVNPGVSFVVGLFDASGTATYNSDKYSFIEPTGVIVSLINDSYFPSRKSNAVINFLNNAVYGTLAIPITADPDVDVSGSKYEPIGAKALMIHNSGVPPTFDNAKFKATSLSIAYAVNQMNYIEFTYLSSTVTLYTIYQQV